MCWLERYFAKMSQAKSLFWCHVFWSMGSYGSHREVYRWQYCGCSQWKKGILVCNSSRNEPHMNCWAVHRNAELQRQLNLHMLWRMMYLFHRIYKQFLLISHPYWNILSACFFLFFVNMSSNGWIALALGCTDLWSPSHFGFVCKKYHKDHC